MSGVSRFLLYGMSNIVPLWVYCGRRDGHFTNALGWTLSLDRYFLCCLEWLLWSKGVWCLPKNYNSLVADQIQPWLASEVFYSGTSVRFRFSRSSHRFRTRYLSRICTTLYNKTSFCSDNYLLGPRIQQHFIKFAFFGLKETY